MKVELNHTKPCLMGDIWDGTYFLHDNKLHLKVIVGFPIRDRFLDNLWPCLCLDDETLFLMDKGTAIIPVSRKFKLVGE